MKSLFSPAKNIAFMALFASLTCVCTLVIQVPLPTGGYFNVGDVFVFLAAWCLGPLYGAIAAGVGGALADLVSGYAIYAPATLIIKAFVAVVAYMAWSFLKTYIKKEGLSFIPRLVSSFVSEMLMVAGYFFYDALLYGFAGAASGVIGNVMQGVCCSAIAVILIIALCRAKPFKTFFPKLTK